MTLLLYIYVKILNKIRNHFNLVPVASIVNFIVLFYIYWTMQNKKKLRKIILLCKSYVAYGMYWKLFSIRRFSVCERNRPRDVEGFFACTFAVAFEKDPEAFIGMTRMTAKLFDILMEKVAHKEDSPLAFSSHRLPQCNLVIAIYQHMHQLWRTIRFRSGVLQGFS